MSEINKDIQHLTESRTDYFLRYIATFPLGDEDLHRLYEQDCPCEPYVEFDKENGWHKINHKKF